MTLDRNQKALIAANRAIFSNKQERIDEIRAFILHAALGAVIGSAIFITFVSAL